MKNLKLYFFILFILANFSLSAQLFQENKLSVGASYGLDIEKLGLQIGGRLDVTDQITLDVNAIYYKYDEGYAYEVNLNPCYYFGTEDFRPYGLLGLNISSTSFSILGQSFKGREFGLNIGGGVEYNLEKIGFYLEPKYTIGGFDQLNVCAGIRVVL